MSSAPPFTFTNESITVIWDGKSHVVQKGAANFTKLKNVILQEKWDEIPGALTIKNDLAQWAKGKFTVSGNTFSYDGAALPSELNDRILALTSNGTDPTPVMRFWERLQKNPSMRSVEQLWKFLQHQGIPLTKDGHFLAYKGVTSDLKDAHSHTWDNSPGAFNEMPRNKISDDPRQPCHEGFHVGALGYARGFSQRVVVCKVDPADVVCVPYDEGAQKMRVCKYRVIGHHNGTELPSSYYEDNNDLERKEETKAATDPEKSKPKKNKAAKKGFAKFDKFDRDGLMGLSIEVLRKYAGKGLEIIGASKIPGGKAVLVSEILKVRSAP